MKRFFVYFIAVLLMAPGLQADARDSRGQALRAAYSYNFSKFISFEQAATNIRFCYFGDSSSLAQQLTSLNGKPVPTGEFSVTQITSGEQIDQCNMVYWDSEKALPESNIELPIVIISDSEHPNITFRFIEKENKLFFEVDVKEAERRGIEISSKLLRLAIIK